MTIQSIQDRFWSKVRKTAAGCWIFTGAKDSSGYGQFTLNGNQVKAHRFSYALAHGEITSKLLVLHDCDTPACVNPGHLKLGTHADNTQDMIRKGRSRFGGLTQWDWADDPIDL